MTQRNKRHQSAHRASRRLTGERLEHRQMLAANLGPRHNLVDPEDVNDDGSVGPMDALIVINELNAEGARAGGHFVDVNNDGLRSPLDVLLVMNRLNRGGRPGDGPVRRPENPPADSAVIRTIDGSANNLENPEWGSSDEQLARLAPVDYADGISAPAGSDRPSAREISNVLSAHGNEATPNARETSAFLYVWGQFLDHDIDLTTPPDSSGETLSIDVPAGDPFFDPANTGTQVIRLTRSRFDDTTGTDDGNPRQQINQVTAWIDGSMIYGSDDETAASLRSFIGGRLKIGDDGLLPLDEEGNFLAGDIRASENIELLSMHVLFVREHNYWADRIAAQNPDLADEAIFQRARGIVIAEIQAITYDEFLPALLGARPLSRYTGYDPLVDPNIANEFSTAAFRFGHSTVNEDIEFFGNDGRAVRNEVELREAFFNPDLLRETGIDSILKYVASSQSEEVDLQVVDSLRNFLFGEPGQGGFDLVALNIQRGRDHGLADYNSVRGAYGLARVSSFSEITSDPELQQKLADLYGSVDNIDLWVGGLAEDHLPGSSLGETFQRIIADQFERLRAGDRLWYQNLYSGNDLAGLQRTRLADVIRRNTAVDNLQENVFFFRASVQGTIFQDANQNGRLDRHEDGLAGVAVELLDDEGTILTITQTNAQGRFRFDAFAETGDYQVRVRAAPELGIEQDLLEDLLVSRGNQRLRDVNFGVSLLEQLAIDVASSRNRLAGNRPE